MRVKPDKPQWDGKPGHYIIDRTYPVRVLEPGKPEVLVNGVWTPYTNPDRLCTDDAVLVEQSEFDELVAYQLAAAQRRGPADFLQHWH